MSERVTIKWESSVLSDRVQQEALVRLLIDKKLITEDELLEMAKEIQLEPVGLYGRLKPGQSLNVNGAGEGFSGDYYVEEVTHTLNSRGYETQLTLARNELPTSHIVKKGETLTGIAKRYYGSPEVWQVIAETNDIEEPRRLEAGNVLTIPKL